MKILITNNVMKKQLLHILLLSAYISTADSYAQKLDNLTELKLKSQNEIFHNLGKAPHTPAFDAEGYWVWGSSVVKGEDGKYHMLPKDIG